MATNLAIDEELLAEAQALGQKRTKRETVNEALREYIARHRRQRAVEGFGTIDFAPDWDHKKARRR